MEQAIDAQREAGSVVQQHVDADDERSEQHGRQEEVHGGTAVRIVSSLASAPDAASAS
jgi:hypothetical protein